MGPVSPRTGMSNASPCHRCLLPAAQEKAHISISLSDKRVKIKRQLGVTVATYSAGVALQELDLLVQFDVVGPQAVQLVLQGLHRLLHGAILLQAETEETKTSEDSDDQKKTATHRRKT